MFRVSLSFLLLLLLGSCNGQDRCGQLMALKQKYYGFKPKYFNARQLDAKSAELDKFWELAKSNKQLYAPCLKEMILSEQKDTYFCFDAASLLFGMDDKHEYLDVVKAGLMKSDLKDLQLEPYLRISYYLGMKGLDIGPLAEKLIGFPNAKIFLTQHAINLNAIDASLFLYNSMETVKAEANLIAAIDKGNTTAKHNAAILLNILATDRGDRLIDSLIQNKVMPDSTRDFVFRDRKTFMASNSCKSVGDRAEILGKLKGYPITDPSVFAGISGNDEIICAASKLLGPGDVELIRTARQRSVNGISDEALYEYFALTKILMSVRK